MALNKVYRSSSKDEEAKINLAFRSMFSGADGQLVLNYLRNISFNIVLDPANHKDSQLWFQEGAKSIVYVIQQRIREANE